MVAEPSKTTAPGKVAYDLGEMQPWREYAVVLFNDDEHSFAEVEVQLVRALNCSLMVARTLSHRVNDRGHATIAIADRERAYQIAAILRQIALQVALRRVN